MPYGKRKTYKDRDAQGRFSKRTKTIAKFGYQEAFKGNKYTTAAAGAAAAVSAGWDLYKTPAGTFRQTSRAKPTQLAHGWYVDMMTGIQHKPSNTDREIIAQAGRKSDFQQTAFIGDTILNRINQVVIFTDWDLTQTNAVTTVAEKTLLTTSRQKVMFTNMSNTKICYEYYLVTPKNDAANSVQAEFNLLSNINSSAGGFDVITTWNPAVVPELTKNWRFLSKAVFRLAPGETGEIHCKSSIYKQLTEANRRNRTLQAGITTQLYCRWYGCPTAQQTIATGAIVNPNAAFGDDLLHSSWIIEQTRNYYKTSVGSTEQRAWITNVPALVGGNQVVTHAQTDDDITVAE